MGYFEYHGVGSRWGPRPALLARSRSDRDQAAWERHGEMLRWLSRHGSRWALDRLVELAREDGRR